MKYPSLHIAAALILLSSCSKGDSASALDGSYVETTPNAGQRTLQFIAPDLMLFHERGSTHADTFYYRVDSGKLHLTAAWAPNQSSEIEFEIIDDRTLRTEYLGVQNGMTPMPDMIFKK